MPSTHRSHELEAVNAHQGLLNAAGGANRAARDYCGSGGVCPGTIGVALPGGGGNGTAALLFETSAHGCRAASGGALIPMQQRQGSAIGGGMGVEMGGAGGLSSWSADKELIGEMVALRQRQQDYLNAATRGA